MMIVALRLRFDRFVLGALRLIYAFTLQCGLHRTSRINDHHPSWHAAAHDQAAGGGSAACWRRRVPRMTGREDAAIPDAMTFCD